MKRCVHFSDKTKTGTNLRPTIKIYINHMLSVQLLAKFEGVIAVLREIPFTFTKLSLPSYILLLQEQVSTFILSVSYLSRVEYNIGVAHTRYMA